ncbi:MAG TPA: peptide-methionine (R)-S-oxide reductase MsrB [Thermoanaerobaculia bacterium]|nr:peptide-methionine (R)-S-oxide reductase MsrB [Thermoanaerobaculia bacterium]
MKIRNLAVVLCIATLAGCDGLVSNPTMDVAAAPTEKVAEKGTKFVDSKGNTIERIVKSDDEWKKEMTAEEFQVMRKQGTERAFTGKYWNTHEKGTYLCGACGLELFSSDTKFDSGTGWPSFWQPLDPTHVATETDRAWGMARTEVHCARCGAHLGHVFDDGPKPTGQRYCMNSVSLDFKKAE